MQAKKLSQDVSVGEQISIDDVSRIVAAGFKSILCNRPDNEVVGQAAFAEIAAVAAKAGIETRYIPAGAGLDPQIGAAAFAKAMKDLPKPAFAYCRSGARSTMLFQMSQQYN